MMNKLITLFAVALLMTITAGSAYADGRHTDVVDASARPQLGIW